MARRPRDRKSLMAQYDEYLQKVNEDLERLEELDPDSVALDRWRGYFQPITTEEPNYRWLQKAVSQIRKVSESGMLSPEGQERSIAITIETLKRLGIEGVDRRNFKSIMHFLDDARARGLGSLYSSTQLIEAITFAKKKKLTKSEINANIKKWSKDLLKMDKEGRVVEIIKPPKLNVRHVRKK